jgi:hypothetical protein
MFLLCPIIAQLSVEMSKRLEQQHEVCPYGKCSMIPAGKPDSDAAALEGVPPTGSHAQQPYEVLQSASLICWLDASRGAFEVLVIATPSTLPVNVYNPTTCGRPHSDGWCAREVWMR